MDKKNNLSKDFINKSKIDLNLLKIFDAIYTSGSVKKAAAMLNTSSPSISRSLQNLKEHFGDPLFLRDGQKLRATSIAIDLHARTQENLNKLMTNLYDFETGSNHSQIVIQCPIYLSVRIIPMISEFLEKENLKCEIIHQVSDNMVETYTDSLSLRQVDLTFGVAKMIGFSTKSFDLYKENLVFICNKAHPRLSDRFEIGNVTQEKFCYIHTNELPVEIMRNRLENIERVFSLKSPSFISILSLVESSSSVSIIPTWVAKKFENSFNIKILKTSMELPIVDIAVSVNKTNLNKKMNMQLLAWLQERFAHQAILSPEQR